MKIFSDFLGDYNAFLYKDKEAIVLKIFKFYLITINKVNIIYNLLC